MTHRDNSTTRIRLLTPAEHAGDTLQDDDATLTIGNDEELPPLAEHIARAARIDLAFPSFTDGRAYSQAYLLRKRYGFTGDLRATGEVLVDQLLLMERTGFRARCSATARTSRRTAATRPVPGLLSARCANGNARRKMKRAARRPPVR